MTDRLVIYALEIYGTNVGFNVKHTLYGLLLRRNLEFILALIRRDNLLTVVQRGPRHILQSAVLHNDVQKFDVKLILDQLDTLEQVLERLQTAYVRLLLKL